VVTSENRGAFVSSHIHGVDFDGYMLFHTAKGLYAGTKHNSLPELTDPEPQRTVVIDGPLQYV